MNFPVTFKCAETTPVFKNGHWELIANRLKIIWKTFMQETFNILSEHFTVSVWLFKRSRATVLLLFVLDKWKKLLIIIRSLDLYLLYLNIWPITKCIKADKWSFVGSENENKSWIHISLSAFTLSKLLFYKHQNNFWKLFKANGQDTKQTSLTSFWF